MDINQIVMDYLETYIIEELLLEGETEYEYYIDEVGRLIDPTKIHVFLYIENTNEVIKYLTENGLSLSNNIANCQTVCYRDMLYITITSCKEGYEKAKFENSEMEAISLTKIVEKAREKGYKKHEILDLLHRVSICLGVSKAC